ncbi:MAG: ribonuclease III [Ruminococcus sp.]|nr:ribonuclease III [Ruminococcus sp.]
MTDIDRNMTEAEARNMAPLTLAFYGDCVYEQLVRRDLVLTADLKVQELHNRAVAMVNAGFQARASKHIEKLLNTNEMYFFKRGRNSSHIGVPRSSTSAEYRAATGLETLFGYLDITGQTDRAREIFRAIRNYYDIESEKRKR